MFILNKIVEIRRYLSKQQLLFEKGKNKAFITRSLQNRVVIHLQQINYNKYVDNIITVQSLARMHLVRKRYKQMKILGTIFGLKLSLKYFDYLMHTVIVIQSAFRMFLPRTRYKINKLGATILQSMIRGKKTRLEYIRKKKSVNVIQSNICAYLWEYYYVALKEAVIYTQTKLRRKIAQNIKRDRMQGIINMQSSIRMINAQRKYILNKNSVLWLQYGNNIPICF